jgi:hypothetical protein
MNSLFVYSQHFIAFTVQNPLEVFNNVYFLQISNYHFGVLFEELHRFLILQTQK